MKLSEASLTEQQNEVHEKNARDLASGYPDFALPTVLLETVLDATRVSLSANADNRLTDDAGLERAVGKTLSLPRHLIERVRTTFSGSVALDRVVSAALSIAKSSAAYHGLSAIVPEPCLDLVPRILKERSEIFYVGVSRIGSFPANYTQVDALIEEMENHRNRFKERKLMVVLDSPSNPLGMVAGDSELLRLARACGNLDAILIVDHCFLLSGVHYPKKLPNIFNVPGDVCDWIAVWDTGKSIDVGGDKLGFIIPGNRRTADAVAKSLDIIQVGHALRRQDNVFSSILGAPELIEYLDDASRVCRENLTYLRRALSADVAVSQPEAGTFACLYLDVRMNSDEVRNHWMKQGLGVVSSRTFHFQTRDTKPFLRISLFRNLAFFRSSIDRLISVY